MKRAAASIALVLTFIAASVGQSPINQGESKLALPAHQGQLQWRADEFKINRIFCKPNGQEIGIRGKDQSEPK